MSGPLLSTELARAGISPAQTKVDDRKKKDSDSTRVAFGDDDDGQSKNTSEAAVKTAKKQAAKEAKAEGGGEKVKRKRVKLKDLAQREHTQETGAKESQQAEKSSKAVVQTKVKTKETAETQETAAPTLTERAQEAGQARASLGLKKAAGLLMQQSRLTESSVKYETAKQTQFDLGETGLSKTGQQKWMLNNLIDMTNICVEQHTGGKAGEAYESRRDNRLIYMALRGLRDGNECKNPASSTRTGMSTGEYASKQKKAESIISNILNPDMRPEHLPEYSEVA